MTPFEYDFLRKLIKMKSGLALSNDKRYLIESRLMPLVRREGLDGLPALVARLRTMPQSALATEVVEAMATNETFFFRDKVPFEQFRAVMVPALLAAYPGRQRLRVLCAACSTGQEAYSLAIAAREMGDALGGCKIEIVAVDFSNEALERARSALYSQFEVQRGLPIHYLIKYFSQRGEMWEVSPLVRAMVRFQPFNLLDNLGRLGAFDVVFCRNLLIYLDHDTKIDVLDRLSRIVDPSGYLVLGSVETVVGLSDAWLSHPSQRGIFLPNRQRMAASRVGGLGARA